VCVKSVKKYLNPHIVGESESVRERGAHASPVGAVLNLINTQNCALSAPPNQVSHALDPRPLALVREERERERERERDRRPERWKARRETRQGCGNKSIWSTVNEGCSCIVNASMLSCQRLDAFRAFHLRCTQIIQVGKKRTLCRSFSSRSLCRSFSRIQVPKGSNETQSVQAVETKSVKAVARVRILKAECSQVGV
jgi:hypothetical protein